MTNSEKTSEKTWLITGASSGLGLALAEAALRAGERVVGTARRAGRFDALRARYTSPTRGGSWSRSSPGGP